MESRQAVERDFFSVSWMPYRYLIPGMDGLDEALEGRRDLLMTLAVTALPFVYLGVLFTVKRLRSIGAPLFLVGLFFIPFINLLFFVVLSVLPPRQTENEVDHPPHWLERTLPRDRWASFFLSVWAAVLVGLPILAIGINYLQSYGWGVFVGIPFMLGLIATLLHAVHQRRTFWECISVALSACALFGACVFFGDGGDHLPDHGVGDCGAIILSGRISRVWHPIEPPRQSRTTGVVIILPVADGV